MPMGMIRLASPLPMSKGSRMLVQGMVVTIALVMVVMVDMPMLMKVIVAIVATLAMPQQAPTRLPVKC